MPNVNMVIIAGNLTKDVEVKYTNSSTAIATFSVAVNERWKDKDGQTKEKAHFIDCDAWGKTGENIGKYFKRGDPIMVVGKLNFQQWEKDGQKRSKLTVTVDRFEFVGGSKDRAADEKPGLEKLATAGKGASPVPVGNAIQDADIPFN